MKLIQVHILFFLRNITMNTQKEAMAAVAKFNGQILKDSGMITEVFWDTDSFVSDVS